MNHLKWMGHTATVMEIQRGLRQDVQSFDVVIYAKEAAMQAHRFVLCACSDYFRDIFRDIPSDKETTILIPDLKSNILERVLTFIYLGEVCVNSSQLSDFLESINFLGIKSPISFECHINKDEQKNSVIEEELINTEDKDNNQNDEEGSTATETGAVKDFEYLEVYNEDEKMDQYTIEQIETEANNDYIISENVSHTTFTNLPDSKSESVTFKQEGGDITFRTVDNEDGKELITDDGTVEQINFEKDEGDKDKSDTFENDATPYRNEALESAMKAVIDEGMSLQKAANTHQVSKTVLWRRVKKNPGYKIKGNPLIEAAIVKLAQGETLKNVSLALDIPLSTLHRHKMKLYQEGRLPSNVQIRQKGSRDVLKKRLSDAVKACQGGMTQNHASSVFGVPKSTLWRHIKKLNPSAKKEDSVEIKDEITVVKDDQQLEVDDVSFSN